MQLDYEDQGIKKTLEEIYIDLITEALDARKEKAGN